jgi:hypothetical protein
VAAALVVAVASCTEPTPIGIPAGVYVATTYAAGPSAAERVDLLALGVSWTLTVDDDRNVVSHWHVESGNMVSDHSYTGIVHLKGNSATFDMYGADPILTQRVWTLDGDKLFAENQTVADVNATIRFTRQQP